MSMRYPTDGFAGNGDYVAFQYMKYNARGNGGGAGGGSIMLYMPETTPTVTNPNMWGRESMGGPGPLGLAKRRVGERVLGDLNSMDLSKGLDEEAQGRIKGGLKDMMRGIKKEGQAVGKQIGTEMVAGALGMSANSILQQRQGQIYNPNVELIYQGPQFRSFGFSFNMIPKSSGDAQAINAIIQEFKRWSAPKEAGGGMYEIPYVWQVSYMGPAAAHMNRFKPAALTAISVTDNDGYNYYAAHEDGAPVQTTLTLQFKEVDMILRDDHSGPRGF
jgi:hypothetical protein